MRDENESLPSLQKISGKRKNHLKFDREQIRFPDYQTTAENLYSIVLVATKYHSVVIQEVLASSKEFSRKRLTINSPLLYKNVSENFLPSRSVVIAAAAAANF